MKIEELRMAIETYPRRLSEALEKVTKAEQAIEKLEEQIEEEELDLSPVVESSDEDTQRAPDTQEMLLKIDYELALLELNCEQIKGEVELEYRRKPVSGDKVTEATVSAFVKSNPRFVTAKELCLEKKFEREKANMSRRVEYVAKRTESRMEARETVTSPKLERLRERLVTATIALSGAEGNLEEVKASIVSYQLLVQLYTAGLIR